jgi:hypothetical protein
MALDAVVEKVDHFDMEVRDVKLVTDSGVTFARQHVAEGSMIDSFVAPVIPPVVLSLAAPDDKEPSIRNSPTTHSRHTSASAEINISHKCELLRISNLPCFLISPVMCWIARGKAAPLSRSRIQRIAKL